MNISSYHRHGPNVPIPLFLTIGYDNEGVPSQAPKVTIQRIMDAENGADLDDYFWNPTLNGGDGDWQAAEYEIAINPKNNSLLPGLYYYKYEHKKNIYLYLMHFSNTGTYALDRYEIHVVSNEVFVPAGLGVVITGSGSVLGNQALMMGDGFDTDLHSLARLYLLLGPSGGTHGRKRMTKENGGTFYVYAEDNVTLLHTYACYDFNGNRTWVMGDIAELVKIA